MDYELLAILFIGWFICATYVWQHFEDYKKGKEQDHYMKLIMFHLGGGFIVFGFLLILFVLNSVGIIGQ